MSQGSTYQSDVKVMLIGDASPGVSYHIRRKMNMGAKHLGKAMQGIVVLAKTAEVDVMELFGSETF